MTIDSHVTATALWWNLFLVWGASLRDPRLLHLADLRDPRRGSQGYAMGRTYVHETNDNLCNPTATKTTTDGDQQTSRRQSGYSTTRTKQ